MALFKNHYIELDTKRSPRISLQNIVAGETGNRLIITFTNDDAAVTLTASTHRVALRVDSALGTRRQDSAVSDNGVTFSDGKAVILLSKDAFTGGMNRCCLEVYTTDTDTDDTLICSAEFQFVAKGEAQGDNTGVAIPLLVQYEQQAEYFANLAEEAVQGGIVDPTVTEWLETKSDHIDGVIEDEVDDWLDAHPEATTTVENGAVTYAKLNSAVKADLDAMLFALTEATEPTQTAINNKYIPESMVGGLSSSTDFKSYLIPINGERQIRIKTWNLSSARNVRDVAFYTSTEYGSDTYISCGDVLQKNGTEAIERVYNIPATAVAAVVCGSKSTPTGETTPVIELLTIRNVENDEDVIKNLTDVLTDTIDVTADYIKSAYINLNKTIGSYIDITTPTQQTGWAYIVLKCYKGDTFEVYGSSGTTPRLWAFLDSNKNLLSVAANQTSATEDSPITVVAPANGYFVSDVNANSSSGYGLTSTALMSAASKAYVLAEIQKYFPSSDYKKNTEFGAFDVSGYIHVSHGSFDLFTASTTASDVYGLYHTLSTESDGYMVETELGLSSDGVNKLYSYTLKPLGNIDEHAPKFFIISGQHGFEKGPVFGLYYFVRELVKHYADNPSLMYLRDSCEIIIIPLMNPHGFNNNSYTNYNGVNLNRNWDVPGWSQGTPGTTSYAGEEPGDQVETQYASALLCDNLDTFWFCDFHSNGQAAVSAFSSCVWHAFGTIINQDDYTKIAISAAYRHINDLSSRFCIDYSDDVPDYTVCGHITNTISYSVLGLAANYARYKGVQGETMEGFSAFPGGATYKPSCHQANADIIANWLRCLLLAYERKS